MILHWKFHAQNGAVYAKPIKKLFGLAIKHIETIFNDRERKGALYGNGDYKQL